MPLLGYESWQKFEGVLEKARLAIQNQGKNVQDYINPSDNIVLDKHNREFIKVDFNLSRYACYIIAMNGDPRKEQIAQAQGYFAISTHQYQQLPKDPSKGKKLLKQQEQL